MKILWFTNTACSGALRLGLPQSSGFWLSSLEKEIARTPGYELCISFYHHVPVSPFQLGSVHYIPVYRPKAKTKFGRAVQRAVHNQDKQDRIEIGVLRDIIANVKPDIIHIHGTEENFGLISEFQRIPTLISIQGIVSAITQFYFAGIPVERVQKHSRMLYRLLRSTFIDDFESLKKKARRERRMLSQIQYVMGRTDWDRRIAYLLAPNSLYFQGGEILRPEFFRHQWSVSEVGPVLKIMTVLNDSLYKGLETIVSAATLLLTSSKLKCTWKIIGISEQSKTARLVKSVFQCDFNAIGLKFIGPCTAEQIIDIGLSSHLYCQASHIENSPNSLCEAMALGMPTIATSAGGTSSLLRGDNDGILVQPGCTLALTSAILELIRNFEKARELGRNAREKAALRHKPDIIAGTVVETYNQILNSHQP